MFQALTLSTIFQGVAVGLVEPKLRRYQQHPEHGDGVGAWNVRRSSNLGGLPENTSLNSVAAKASRLRHGNSFRHAPCCKDEQCHYRHHHLLQHKFLPAGWHNQVTWTTGQSVWFHITSVTGIAYRHGQDIIFLFSKSSRPLYGAQPVIYSIGTRTTFSACEAAGAWSWQPTSNAGVLNGCKGTSAPHTPVWHEQE